MGRAGAGGGGGGHSGGGHSSGRSSGGHRVSSGSSGRRAGSGGGSRMEEDSTVVDFIHGRRYGIPFLSVVEAGLIPLYQLSYSLLSLLLHLEVFRHQNHLQQKTYQKTHRTGNDWNPV